jgi:membrane protein implicated in regulation of membrane protease activity
MREDPVEVIILGLVSMLLAASIVWPDFFTLAVGSVGVTMLQVLCVLLLMLFGAAEVLAAILNFRTRRQWHRRAVQRAQRRAEKATEEDAEEPAEPTDTRTEVWVTVAHQDDGTEHVSLYSTYEVARAWQGYLEMCDDCVGVDLFSKHALDQMPPARQETTSG